MTTPTPDGLLERVLAWASRLTTAAVRLIQGAVGRLVASVRQAASTVRVRHLHQLDHDRRYAPALAAGLTAALGVIAPHRALAAALAVLIAEHLHLGEATPFVDDPDDGWPPARRTTPRTAWDSRY